MSEIRIATTTADEAESDWWQPGGETYMQATGPEHVTVIVEGRIDPDTVAAEIERTSIRRKPILRYAQLPWLRVRFIGNATAGQVTIKSVEQ